MPDGWSLSMPRSRNCSVAASRSAFDSIFGVLSLFESALGHGTFIKQDLLTIPLHTGEPLVGFGFEIVLISARDIVALNAHQNLAPFFTSSPRRAFSSTTRPDASETTGTARVISDCTTPVTFKAGAVR